VSEKWFCEICGGNNAIQVLKVEVGKIHYFQLVPLPFMDKIAGQWS
jgi:hypothetical protein